MTCEIGVQPTITVEHYEVVMETSSLGYSRTHRDGEGLKLSIIFYSIVLR